MGVARRDLGDGFPDAHVQEGEVVAHLTGLVAARHDDSLSQRAHVVVTPALGLAVAKEHARVEVAARDLGGGNLTRGELGAQVHVGKRIAHLPGCVTDPVERRAVRRIESHALRSKRVLAPAPHLGAPADDGAAVLAAKVGVLHREPRSKVEVAKVGAHGRDRLAAVDGIPVAQLSHVVVTPALDLVAREQHKGISLRGEDLVHRLGHLRRSGCARRHGSERVSAGRAARAGAGARERVGAGGARVVAGRRGTRAHGGGVGAGGARSARRSPRRRGVGAGGTVRAGTGARRRVRAGRAADACRGARRALRPRVRTRRAVLASGRARCTGRARVGALGAQRALRGAVLVRAGCAGRHDVGVEADRDKVERRHGCGQQLVHHHGKLVVGDGADRIRRRGGVASVRCAGDRDELVPHIVRARAVDPVVEGSSARVGVAAPDDDHVLQYHIVWHRERDPVAVVAGDQPRAEGEYASRIGGVRPDGIGSALHKGVYDWVGVVRCAAPRHRVHAVSVRLPRHGVRVRGRVCGAQVHAERLRGVHRDRRRRVHERERRRVEKGVAAARVPRFLLVVGIRQAADAVEVDDVEHDGQQRLRHGNARADAALLLHVVAEAGHRTHRIASRHVDIGTPRRVGGHDHAKVEGPHADYTPAVGRKVFRRQEGGIVARRRKQRHVVR